MSLWKSNNIDKVWANICKHEGEVFLTPARNQKFTYIVKCDYIIINDGKSKRINKEGFEQALNIQNLTRAKIAEEGIWWSSYVHGILIDKRII